MALMGVLAFVYVATPPASHAGSAVSPAGADFFGLNAQLIGSAPYPRDDPAALAQNTDAIAGLGIRLVRVNVDWREVEPTAPVGGQHTYQWQGIDRLISQAARSGLRVYPDVAGTAFWATTAERNSACVIGLSQPAPIALADYASFAGAVAFRYGPGGLFWEQNASLPYLPVRQEEIWNEANWAGWCPAPEPELYAQMTAGAADAIHGVDPGIEVVLGGLAVARPGDAPSFAMDFETFVDRMFAAVPALAQKLGAIGLHPYAATPEGVEAQVAWARQAIDEGGGAGLPLDLNEIGWTTGGGKGAIPEATRAAYVEALASRLWRADCQIQRIFLHTWRTAELSPSDPEDWYGVADPATAEPYPTARAYAAELALAAASPPSTGAVQICDREPPRVQIDRLRRKPDRLRIYFSSDERARFECRLGSARWRRCRSPVSYRRVPSGRHRFRVRASDAAGNTATATRRFTVRH
jgi:hypothetical protein